MENQLIKKGAEERCLEKTMAGTGAIKSILGALNSVILSRIEASVQLRRLILIDEPHVRCTRGYSLLLSAGL